MLLQLWRFANLPADINSARRRFLSWGPIETCLWQKKVSSILPIYTFSVCKSVTIRKNMESRNICVWTHSIAKTNWCLTMAVEVADFEFVIAEEAVTIAAPTGIWREVQRFKQFSEHVVSEFWFSCSVKFIRGNGNGISKRVEMSLSLCSSAASCLPISRKEANTLNLEAELDINGIQCPSVSWTVHPSSALVQQSCRSNNSYKRQWLFYIMAERH